QPESGCGTASSAAASNCAGPRQANSRTIVSAAGRRMHNEASFISMKESLMPESHKRVLQKLNEAIRRKDFDACMAYCTDDTEWTFVGERTLSGKAAVREWMERAYQDPPRFQVHRMIAEDDALAV